ncbi:MAG: hypothetical protein ACP5G6_07945 [Conexivisphaera sp.]
MENVLAAAGGRIGLPGAAAAGATRRRDRIPADEFEPEGGQVPSIPGPGTAQSPGRPTPEEFLMDLWSYASGEARCFAISLQTEGAWIPRFFCREDYG